MRKNKNPSGNSIHGDLTCFEKTQYEQTSIICRKHIPNIDQLVELRNCSKDASALRVRYSAIKSNHFNPISLESENIIIDFLENNMTEHTASIVSCIISTYNTGEAILSINSPKYQGSDTFKSFKHASKDCQKAMVSYVDPIQKNIKTQLANAKRIKNQEDINNCLNLIDRYEGLNSGVEFFCEYILELNDSMPKYIDKDTYARALIICNNQKKELSGEELKNYRSVDQKYAWNESNNNYALIRPSGFSSVSQECATCIICYNK